MLELITFFNTLFEAVRGFRTPLGRLLIQPVVTVVILLAIYVGSIVLRAPSLTEGLYAVFIDTDTDRLARAQALETAVIQTELHHLAESNQMVDRLLEGLTAHSSSIARARLDVIHNGVKGVTGMGLLRYDVTNAVPGAGHTGGPLAINQPLSEWSEFLSDLLNGDCRLLNPAVLHSAAIRARLESMNTGTILVCPVSDFQGRLLGAIVIGWDVGTALPDDLDMKSLMHAAKDAGMRIAAVLDLRAAASVSAVEATSKPR